MKSTLIDTVNEKSIVKLEKAGRIEWLVCRDYDDSKPEGSKWSSADYFDSLQDAVESLKQEEPFYLVTIVPEEPQYSNSYAVIKGRGNVFKYLKICGNTLVFNYPDGKQSEAYNKGLEELKKYDSTTIKGVGSIYISEYELGDEIRD